MNRVKRILAVCTAICLLFMPVMSVRGASAADKGEMKTLWQSYDGKRIGMRRGDRFPDAS